MRYCTQFDRIGEENNNKLFIVVYNDSKVLIVVSEKLKLILDFINRTMSGILIAGAGVLIMAMAMEEDNDCDDLPEALKVSKGENMEEN